MKNYKGILYGAVAYSVFIGLIYVALSVLGLMTRWCMIESKGNPLNYLLYLIYFRVESCEADVDWNLLNIASTQSVPMPSETSAVYFTFLYLIVYLSLHAILVLTSLYALCGVNNSCLGRRSFPLFFLPWIIIWWLIIIIDVLATAYYIFDVVKLSSVDGLMSILEVEAGTAFDEVLRLFEQLSSITIIMPPIIMMLAASKIFIFIIINIVWVIAITRAGWAASTYHMYHDQTRRNYENTMANVNPAFEGMRDDVVAQKQHEKQMEYLSDQSSIHEVPSSSPRPTASAPLEENVESRYNDTSRVQAQAYPYHMSNTRNEKQRRDAPQPPKQIVEDDPQTTYKIKRPTTLVLPERPERPPSQQQQYHHQNSNQYQNNNNNESDREIDNRLSRYQETSGHAIKTIEPIKYDDIPEQQQSNTRVLVLPPISESRPHSLKPIPPPKPHNYNTNNNNINNNRFSVQPMPVGRESPVLYRPERSNSNRVAVERTSSNVRAPEELRSQLPWSYFKPRDATPKKAFDHLEENEDIPAVPVPDYTLHYGKKGRSNLGDNESDGNWSHSRY
ncbi:uncharacterized protein [Chironomus tepperi]|uniref:uncharacterized protein n=1 Tax=Chironomus tepperi TaxID=113505 RepID=UPI00391F99B9